MSLTEQDQSAAYYDQLAARYDDELMATAGDVLARRAFIDIVTSELPKGATILDFGSGTGLDAKAYAEAGYRVLAYDNSAGMMAQLRRRCSREIESGAVQAADGTVSLAEALTHWPRPDAVVANFAVLNMMDDVAPLLQLMARRLAPRGLLVVSIINPRYWKHLTTRRWWRGMGRRARGLRPHYLTTHFTSYLHSLPSLLRAAADFELIGTATAGRLVRYDVGPGSAPRYWNDLAGGGVLQRVKRLLWHSPVAPSLGTFTFLVLRARP